MGFSRQEYGNGWLFPSPGDLPDPGIEPGAPELQVDSVSAEPPGKPPGSGLVSYRFGPCLQVGSQAMKKDKARSGWRGDGGVGEGGREG